MAERFPKTIDEVDSAWLSAALGAKVNGFKHRFIEGGVLSDAYIVHDIEYANGTQAPRSLVAKFANRVDERRAQAVANNAYAKELAFYRELAERVPLRSPAIYSLATDDEQRPEFFVIAMEDLTVHSKVFDQVDDPPNEHFMRRIALELAEMHGRFWESSALDAPWLGGKDYEFPLDAACRACPEEKKTFLELYRQMFGEDIFDLPGCEQTRAITDVITGPDCAAIIDHVYGIWSTRPRTLLHGDMRADNIFRTRNGTTDHDDAQLTYVDWQLVGAGPPGPEFTQAWQHSAPPELRRKDLAILRDYHDRLLAVNPEAARYSYDMLLDDYRLGFILWWMALITIGAATMPIFDKPEGARMKRLWGQGLYYMNVAMTDHDCLRLVKGIVAEI